MNDDLRKNLLDLIQAAIDLANSVQEDAKLEGYISDKTLLNASYFIQKHDDLDTILDILNGIN